MMTLKWPRTARERKIQCPIAPVKHVGGGVWVCRTRWGRVKRKLVGRKSGTAITRLVRRRRKRRR